MRTKAILNQTALKAKILNLLARREHSRSELIYKFKNQLEADIDLCAVLDEFEEKGYLSDERFAEMIMRHRTRQYVGPEKILYELKQKGISKKIIDTLFETESPDWKAQAKALYEKRFGQQAAESIHEKAKRYRYLVNQGYPAEIVQTILKVNVEE